MPYFRWCDSGAHETFNSCSGDGLGGKPKSQEPRGQPERNEEAGSAETMESGSEGQAPEEVAMADEPQG